MRDLQKLEFHPTQEKMVDILCAKTQNSSRSFFRLMFAYYASKISTMMQVEVKVEGIGSLPTNMYVFNLAPSGSGKGRSMNILEDQVLGGFRERFMQETFPMISAHTMQKWAVKRANRNGTDPDTEEEVLQNEFSAAGPLLFSFDSATTAAVKQMRHKLLMAGLGSMNMELDEIGSNFTSNGDVLTTYLELYDVGKVKQKLIKHTKENARSEDLGGKTPANMLLFGTPTKLLNGSKTEDEFYEMLEVGYARRSFFGYSRHKAIGKKYSAEEIFDLFTDTNSDNYMLQLSDKLAERAEPTLAKLHIPMHKDVVIELLKYRQHCDAKAEILSEYEEIKKAEIKHRYFKTAKLAGAYAFLDGSHVVTEDHLYQAIAMAEMSGEAFNEILDRDRPYVKLANYITSINREVTQADLMEDLPFYKGSEVQRREMMTLAMAHAFRNNSYIRKDRIDDIDFYSGKAVAETSLDQMIVSYSSQMTTNYVTEQTAWAKLSKLFLMENFNFVNHALKENPDYPGQNGYRSEHHVIPGFNMIIIDVDGGTDINLAKLCLQDYTYFMYTTKRHTNESHRFRIIIPTSHVLELDTKDYRQFMTNIYEWMPFDVDTQTNERSRKWLTNKGSYHVNSGQLLDVFQFVPKTKKAEQQREQTAQLTNLSALERWFVRQAEDGSRNNMLTRYAFVLIDMKLDFDSIKNNVLALNGKLRDPLDESEILSTIMVTVNRKLLQKS